MRNPHLSLLLLRAARDAILPILPWSRRLPELPETWLEELRAVSLQYSLSLSRSLNFWYFYIFISVCFNDHDRTVQNERSLWCYFLRVLEPETLRSATSNLRSLFLVRILLLVFNISPLFRRFPLFFCYYKLH